jgi:Arc/MetJ-type ribon-helix-helix transcriptional regulator
MTIHLPPEIECSIEAAVHSGQFASLDAAMTEAAELLLKRLEERKPAIPSEGDSPFDPVLGSMRDDADLLDEIVEHAMKNRRERPWRLTSGE